MTFVSLTFLLFFPTVFALYWGVRRRAFQNCLLIAASYLFYGWWDYRFCALMLASSLLDYGIGLTLANAKDQRIRKLLMLSSVVANLGLLGLFKYYGFFAENLQLLTSHLGWNLNWSTLHLILPVGISFYTFQTMSYTIDIYRGKLQPTRNMIDYLAFVSFFPQLVAGPIERARNLLPQFAADRSFDGDEAADGCRQILWGFFTKVAIADRMAIFVDSAYDAPTLTVGPTLALATIGFAVQVYCDFAAYSHIAVGTAKMFNIKLMRNFAYPFFSQSMTELWQRWHISLSSWLRDYVCLPLDGRGRSNPLRRMASIIATFLLCGLWHGAAWHFVVWGGLNGILVAGETRMKRVRPGVPGGEDLIPNPRVALRIIATFGAFCFTVLFFRASSLADAMYIAQTILCDALSAQANMICLERLASDEFALVTFAITIGFFAWEWVQRRELHALNLPRVRSQYRWSVYTVCIWGSLLLMPTTVTNPFIYFVF